MERIMPDSPGKTGAGANHTCRMLGSLLERCSDAFFIIDIDTGVILSANITARQNLGYGDVELTGKPVTAIFSAPRGGGDWNSIADELRKTPNLLLHMSVRQNDGTSFPAELNLKYQRCGDNNLVLGIVKANRQEPPLDEESVTGLLDAIIQAQSTYISGKKSYKVFNDLLNVILSFTKSQYGFVTEYVDDGADTPYLRPLAITNIAWNNETKRYFEEGRFCELRFDSRSSLISAIIDSGRPVISNNPSVDKRSGGVPEGHPPLNTFMGLPIQSGGKLVGAIGIANRPGGYDNSLAEYLHPLIGTCATIIEAVQNQQLRESTETELKQSEERFRTIADFTFDWETWCGPDGGYIYVSPSCERITGYSREEFIKDPSLQMKITHPEDRDIVSKHLQTFKSEDVQHMEFRVVSRDGQTRWISHYCQSVYNADGVWMGRRASNRDVTRRTLSEQELQKEKEKAEKATKLKDKFVSLVAHDLKSPLSSAMSLLKLISSGGRGSLTPKHQKMLRHVISNGDYMIRMIEELLNISLLQTGKITPRPKFIDGHMAVVSAIGNLSQVAKEKEVEIENKIRQGTRLYADPALFGVVIHNLVSNSIKFCGPGDRISIFAPQGRQTTVAVRDTGSGIASSLLPDLFKHEIKTTTLGTADERGTGLGLPYSYDILAAHGGELTLDTEVGKGSVFYATLPSVRPRVLVVDDDKVTRHFIVSMLKKIEVDTVEAENGADAFDMISGGGLHLVICDVIMPEMDGLELLEKVRRNHPDGDIPFITITSDSGMTTREQVFLAGANDYIQKPFAEQDIIPRVKRFVF